MWNEHGSNTRWVECKSTRVNLERERGNKSQSTNTIYTTICLPKFRFQMKSTSLLRCPKGPCLFQPSHVIPKIKLESSLFYRLRYLSLREVLHTSKPLASFTIDLSQNSKYKSTTLQHTHSPQSHSLKALWLFQCSNHYRRALGRLDHFLSVSIECRNEWSTLVYWMDLLEFIKQPK
jgi:hypothetical protein